MARTARTSKHLAVLAAAVALTLAPGGTAGAQSPPPTPTPTHTLPAWEKPAPTVTVTQPAPSTATPTTPPAAPRQATPNASTAAVPIIIDTDIFGSADDAGALAEANAMQDNGQVRILGVVVNYPSQYGATAADAIDAYYGHDIPIGIVQPTTAEVSKPDYAQYLTANFPHPNVSDGSTAPDAVSLYRKLLAAQPDHSVVIVAIGLETNLANLLNSPADSYSSLNGTDLVAAKVKSLNMMGGQFPSSGTPGEYNWVADASSATQVVNNWTLPAEYEGYEVGANVLTGAGLGQTPATNPVRVAYERMVGAGTNMSSWDPVNMYVAGLGLNGLFGEGPPGSPVVNPDGSNTWDTNSGKGQHYLVESATPDAIAAKVEALMDQAPTTGGDPIVAHYNALGGPGGFLGATVGGEYGTANGGKAQDYQHGTILWSAASGAWSIQGAIRDKYNQLGGPGVLGYPVNDETGTPDGVGRYNHFNASFGASIYWTPNTGAHEIQGAIRSLWAGEGWERGICGYPVTDESGTPDGIGRYNHFSASDGASIYWTPNTGAHEIQGAIRSKWAAMGWETGPVGYPVTDETGTPDGIGRYNHFSRSDGASIYWSPSSGANAIYGAIRGTWAQLGWETSRLRYPTTDEYGINGGRRNDFLGGWIIYWFSSGTTQVGYN